MSITRTLGGLALGALVLAGCEQVTPASNTGPIGLTPGTVQEQLRQQQLQNARSGVNPGVQNPITGVNPGTTGITRATDATGTQAAPIVSGTGSITGGGIGGASIQRQGAGPNPR